MMKNKRIIKKLNKRAAKLLIERGEFHESSFYNNYQQIEFCMSSEDGNEYSECMPYEWILSCVYDMSYNLIVDETEYKYVKLFTIKNAKQVFDLYQKS